MGTEQQVAGLRELGIALRELPRKMELTVVGKAVGAAAGMVKDAAARKAPKYEGRVSAGHPKPGTLQKAIRIRRIRGLPLSRVVYEVFVKHGKKLQHVGKRDANKDAFYFWWVEFGSIHNVPAKPFLRPAFEQQKGKALILLIEKLSSGLARCAREVAFGRNT